jgi:hypothetical protein
MARSASGGGELLVLYTYESTDQGTSVVVMGFGPSEVRMPRGPQQRWAMHRGCFANQNGTDSRFMMKNDAQDIQSIVYCWLTFVASLSRVGQRCTRLSHET